MNNIITGVKRIEIFEFHTSPKQLRELADKIDAAMEHTEIGQDVPFIEIRSYSNPDIRVRITANQDAFHRKEKGDWK